VIPSYDGVNRSRTYTAQMVTLMEIKRYGKIIATKMEMDNDVINIVECSEKKCNKL